MIERYKLVWVYLVSILFLVLNAFFITRELFWGAFLPVTVLVLFLFLFSLDKLLLLITFLTPLAVNLRSFEYGVGISIPTEPLLFGVLLIFVFKLLYERKYDWNVLRHPVTLAILINLLWLFVTSLTSQIPLVSFKFLIARLWFVVPFYFIGTQLFRNISNIKKFSWLYVIPLIGVIFYTIYRHSLYGFAEDPGHWVMSPFYNDHTAYGAMLAFFIPVTTGFILNNRYKKSIRFMAMIVTVILTGAMVLSYSRAAWISLAVAVFVFFLIVMKVKLRWLALIAVALVSAFFAFKLQIYDWMEKNKQESSRSLMEHVQSISNITSDASNLERINRWQCAIRMFHERPMLGWGPGTYQFEYAPFQRSKEKTIISTNAGDRGNAHSEYIGPLAESGVLGMLTFVAMMSVVIFRGIRIYQKNTKGEARILALMSVLALVTYLTHGLLNNFLDTDKASVPFWAFIAMIVAIDLYHTQKKTGIPE